MPAPSPPAADSLIMEQLIQLRHTLDALIAEAHDHWETEERRYTLIDKFVDAELPIDGLLKQVLSTLTRDHRALLDLQQQVRLLERAVELAIDSGGIDRLTNGRRVGA